MKRVILLWIFTFFSCCLTWSQKVVSITVDGTINPASAEYIQNGIEKASKENAEVLIINLNTPGGLLKSTRVIVGAMLDAPVPIVVYVSPGGAQAGSAGVFITMAAHIAAMAPGTNIGAAHPVGMQGQTDSVMSGKITNDAAAFIRTIADKRSRNVEWAEQAVRQSVSITETEALEKNVINLVAKNQQQVLDSIDGKKVNIGSKIVTLNTASAQVISVEMGWIEQLLNFLSDPNVAYILLMVGFYGILFELYSPGTIFPGIIGVISLVLAFYSLHSLPVNYAGLALIIFAVILFVLEIFVISHGLLAIGGVVSLLIGSLMLIRTGPGFEFLAISRSLIVTTTIITALFFLFIVGMGLRAQKYKPVSGAEGMIGEEGEAISLLNPIGRIKIHGEEWNAEAIAGSIEATKKVKVVRVENLKLFVEVIV